MNRIFWLRLLFSFIALSLTTPAYAAFSDVPSNHPNAEAIAYVKAQGVVEGYSDRTFRPDNHINRAEFAKILEESIPDAEEGVGLCFNAEDFTTFSDVHSEWFWIYACMQSGRGIVQGYPDGTFRPATNINFVEAAKMLYGANHLDKRGILVTQPSEAKPWYEPYVRYLESQNAIPTSITRFDQPITRGEMAEMIYRLYYGMNDLPSQTYEGLQTSDEKLSVKLYFGDREVIVESDCGATKAVTRTIPKTSSVADATLRLLFQGTTPQEEALGYSANFDWDTDGMGEPLEPLLSYYRGVTVVNGMATVKFTGGAMAYLNNTACMQAAVKAPIFDTLMQFPSVKNVQFSVDGEIITEWDA